MLRRCPQGRVRLRHSGARGDGSWGRRSLRSATDVDPGWRAAIPPHDRRRHHTGGSLAHMAAKHDVLVLDGDKIAALDIVRTLGRRGLSVAVGAPRADAIAFRSRFARHREVY